MKSPGFIFVLLEILIVSVSCHSNQKENNSRDKNSVSKQTAPDTIKKAIIIVSPGEAAFRKTCLACHQADGSGVPGMYPSLNHAEKIMGPPEEIIKVILFGLKGPTVINGVTYSQPMPPQSMLNDTTIAILVNYVKKRWGDNESAVTPEDVRKIRAAGRH